MGPCEIGLTRQATKTTGTNSLNASSILPRHYQSNPKHGDHCRHGAHKKLLKDKSLQIMMHTMTKIMRTAAMQAAIMVMEIERANKTKDHTGKAAPTPPLATESPPPRTNNDRSSIHLPLLNTIQNSGSVMRISAYKLDAACSNHSRFLVLDLERLKPKSKSTIGNLPANIILTRMILLSMTDLFSYTPVSSVCPSSDSDPKSQLPC